ncbi:MAG TPA: alpha/beta fold hydrolase, partial [Gemmatimonadales bacterium]|nr:alpha/beta fold hydrolase [Gemmatimonadales bacterium]
LVGHSEGGAIGPMIAERDPRLAALVIMAGPGKPGAAILRDQARWPVLKTPGLTPEERRQRLTEAEAAVEADSASPSAWLRWFYEYDPLPTARAVRQPSLILQGALDRQVSAGQADTLARAMKEGGNRDVTVRVFPGLNHLFLPTPGDGSPSEYPTLRQTAIPDTVLDVLTGWLRRRLGAG